MSQEIIEERVGKLESGFAGLRTDVAVMSRDVADVKTQGADVLSAIKTLQEREARRPEAMNWRSIVAACGGIAAVAFVGWWLVEHSPAVVSLRERMDDLDHPKRGSVTVMQRDVDDLKQWRPTVFRN